MTRLYIEDDAGNVQVVPFEADEVTLGRAQDNTIVLPDRNVSRHHARLRRENGRFVVEDAGARYGLKVNGIRISGQSEIKPGDVMLVGDYKLKVLAKDAAIAEAEAPAPRRPERVEEGRTTTVEVRNIQEMDEIAKEGWRSDFDLEEEGRGLSPGKVVLLVFLVIVALGLGGLYYMLSKPAEPVITKPATTAPAITAEGPAAGAGGAAAEEEAPAEEEHVAPAPAPPKGTVKEQKPARDLRKAEVKVAMVERKQPEPKAQEPKAPAPVKTPVVKPEEPPKAGGDDLSSRINAALVGQRWAEAEALLNQCSGSQCVGFWKKLGAGYESSGNIAKAIQAYKRLYRMTNDPNQKARIAAKIQALGGSPD